MKATWHYRHETEPHRPYLHDSFCERIMANPSRTMLDAMENRIRYWGFIEEIGHYLRVVVLEDGETVHTAFIDDRGARR